MTMKILITMEQQTQKVYFDDYYKLILVKTAFKKDKEDKSGYRNGYKLYESRRDKDKVLIVEDYLERTEPYLRGLIKTIKQQNLENGKLS